MRKANNLIEISLLCVVIIVIAVPVTIAFNHQKEIIAAFSKSSSDKQTVNLHTATAQKLSEKVPYAKVETAGTSALSYFNNMPLNEFDTTLSNVNYSDLLAKDDKGTGNSIINYAQALTNNDAAGLSEYKDISETNITTTTLSQLVAILNKVTSEAFKAINDPDVQKAAEGFKERFSALMDAAQSNK